MSSNKTILLVDDNAVQAAIRQVILRRSGYYVITALNPVRALEQLRNGDFPAEVQLVVTDHIMPGMSGKDFVREIRRFDPTLPILVISGLDEAIHEYDGLNVEFQVKPLQPERLLECVHDLMSDASSDEEEHAESVAPPAR